MNLQASKWIQVQALLDVDEMRQFMEHLGSIHLFPIGCLTQGEMTCEEFLTGYKAYIESSGNTPLSNLALTIDTKAIAESPGMVFRPIKPVVLMRPHKLGYSTVDGKFRPNVLGKESIPWGYEFSYPQIFQNEEGNAVKVDRSFPNTDLFQSIRRWLRHHSLPTPFLVNGERINVPIRIGKQCFSWINSYSKLIEKGIKVCCED